MPPPRPRPRPRLRPAARLHPAAEKGCVSADRYVSPFTHLRRLLSILSGLTAGRSPLVRSMIGMSVTVDVGGLCGVYVHRGGEGVAQQVTILDP